MTRRETMGASDKPFFYEIENHDKRTRRFKRWRTFFFSNFLLPSVVATFILFAAAAIVAKRPTTWSFYLETLLHLLLLLFVLFLHWIPNFAVVVQKNKLVARYFVMARNLMIVVFLLAIIPYQLIHHFFDGFPLFYIVATTILAGLIVIAWSLLNTFASIFNEVIDPKETVPRHRMKKKSLYQMFTYLNFFLTIFLFEFWFFAHLFSPKQNPLADFVATPKFIIAIIGDFDKPTLHDYGSYIPPFSAMLTTLCQEDMTRNVYRATGEQILEKSIIPSFALMSEAEIVTFKSNITAWIAAAMLATFGLVAFGGFSVRILASVLPTALQQLGKTHENAEEIALKAHIYNRNFRDYLIKEYSFGLLGFIGTFIYLGIPLFLKGGCRDVLLANSINGDTVFFAAALLAAWIGPVIVAVYNPDDTFGRNFNRAIADLIMQIRGHVVYAGYGDLGKRVVEKDVKRTFMLDRKHNIGEIVTPDLTVARLHLSSVIIDLSDRDFVYAASNDLLGRYGVVAVREIGGMRLDRPPRRGTSKPIFDFWPFNRQHQWQYSAPKNILVLALQGNIDEPFVSARANLERARLLISTVADHHSVNAAFDLVVPEKTKAILCVTRSDQVSYLTYRASAHPVVLVYPTALQGATIGQRIWAAVRKMEELRQLTTADKKSRPRIYVLGSNKTAHYMLENLWMSLPGSLPERTCWMKKHIVLVHFEHRRDLNEEIDDYSSLAAGDEPTAETAREPGIDRSGGPMQPQYLRVKFASGSRYHSEADSADADIKIYHIRLAFIQYLESIFKEAPPDIVVFNPGDSDLSQQVFFRSLRVIEKLAPFVGESDADKTGFPILLFNLVGGGRSERVALGDVSRYYNSVVALYGDPLGTSEVYPGHSRWHRQARRLLRESIIDAKSDAMEMISGVQESLFDGIPGARLPLRIREEHVEINTCIPESPGALANLTAHLAGFNFKPGVPKDVTKEGETIETMLSLSPSFHFLRSVVLDVEGKGVLLNGYALLVSSSQTLAPLPDQEIAGKTSYNFYTRLYVNDGRNYNLEKKDKAPLIPGPGVIGTIDFMTGRNVPAQESGQNQGFISHQDVTIKRFRKILFDNAGDNIPGALACPGMNTCPVSAYQDYVVASNRKGFTREEYGDGILQFAENYSCCADFQQIPTSGEKTAKPHPAARLIVCAQTDGDDPGKVSYMLNTLLFRSLRGLRKGYHQDGGEGDMSWILNIQYLKNMPCHTRHFDICRIFGFWTEASENDRKKNIHKLQSHCPIQLIEILPIGSGADAVMWFTYARALLKFINNLDMELDDAERSNARLAGEKPYRLKWFDQRAKCHHLTVTGQVMANDAEPTDENPPIAIILHRRNAKSEIEKMTPDQTGDYSPCVICGMQGKSQSCESWRPWYKEDDFRWDADDLAENTAPTL